MPATGFHGAGWPVSFALSALATWRPAQLLVDADGPAGLVVRLRRAAGAGVTGQAMDCFYCTSVWVACRWRPGAPACRGEAGRRALADHSA